MSKLKNQVKSAYALPDLEKHSYHLHSICIHDGNASSGHYYSFIYDRFQKKWRRYSDLRVVDVSEEEVMNIAMGNGKSWETAYWLVYIDNSLAKSLDSLDINNYKVPVNPKQPSIQSDNYYGSILPKTTAD